ncbi:MAG: flavin reductase family protein [Calditrichaeota bacterium]|nr:flavin reductase family protein [Calditrichota bacterium]
MKTEQKKIQLPPFVHSYPAPAVLIGCGSISKPNLIACSWFGTVCSEPPMVSVSVRETRFSYQLIHETREFTANLPQVTDIEAINYCGTQSGAEVNKFKQLGLTPLPCPPLKSAPMIAECFFVLGCRVKHELQLGSHFIFIADVVSVLCDERLSRPSKAPDPCPTEQVVYLDGKFWTLKAIE